MSLYRDLPADLSEASTFSNPPSPVSGRIALSSPYLDPSSTTSSSSSESQPVSPNLACSSPEYSPSSPEYCPSSPSIGLADLENGWSFDTDPTITHDARSTPGSGTSQQVAGVAVMVNSGVNRGMAANSDVVDDDGSASGRNDTKHDAEQHDHGTDPMPTFYNEQHDIPVKYSKSSKPDHVYDEGTSSQVSTTEQNDRGERDNGVDLNDDHREYTQHGNGAHSIDEEGGGSGVRSLRSRVIVIQKSATYDGACRGRAKIGGLKRMASPGPIDGGELPEKRVRY